jgi:hypothetical protein
VNASQDYGIHLTISQSAPTGESCIVSYISSQVTPQLNQVLAVSGMTKVGTTIHHSRQPIFMKQLKVVVTYLERGTESVLLKTFVIFNRRRFNRRQQRVAPPTVLASQHYGILQRATLLARTISITKMNGVILR